MQVIILIVSAAMNFWAVYMLTQCHERTSAEAKRQTTYSYSAIMFDIAGQKGVALVEVTLFLTCFGAGKKCVLVWVCVVCVCVLLALLLTALVMSCECGVFLEGLLVPLVFLAQGGASDCLVLRVCACCLASF